MKLKLYPCFKNLESYDQIYFYSDPHFGEPDMIKRRGISDDEQVKRINSKLGKRTVIIFLGDIGDVSYISKIKGYKILVMGNHDAGASNYERVRTKVSDAYHICKRCGQKICPDLRDLANCGVDFAYCDNCYSTEAIEYIDAKYDDNHLFDEVYEGIVALNEKIMLSHEPVNIPFMMNIHGHVHELSAKDDKNHFNVCAEHIDYTPVSLSDMVKSGKFSKIESIHRDTINTATKRKAKREAKRLSKYE